MTRREVLIVFSIPKVWKSRQRKPRYRWPYRVVITAHYKTWTDLYNSLNVARLNSMDILSFFLFVGLVEFHTSRSGGNHGCWCHYWTRVRNSPQRKLGLPSTASVYTNHSKKNTKLVTSWSARARKSIFDENEPLLIKCLVENLVSMFSTFQTHV